MRAIFVAVLGIVGGFIVGTVVAEFVGITGLLLFGGVPELRFIRFLPFVLAIAGAVAAPVVEKRRSR